MKIFGLSFGEGKRGKIKEERVETEEEKCQRAARAMERMALDDERRRNQNFQDTLDHDIWYGRVFDLLESRPEELFTAKKIADALNAQGKEDCFYRRFSLDSKWPLNAKKYKQSLRLHFYRIEGEDFVKYV